MSKKIFDLEITDVLRETNEYTSIFFKKPHDFSFSPGSCFDLSFTKKDFKEGRIFSFSSSPTEQELRVTYRKGVSEYKKRLENVKKGDMLQIYYYGSQYEFYLNRPLIFYAGGIGIAVFRSIIKQAFDMKVLPHITLLYSNSSRPFPFQKELDAWGNIISMRTMYLETQKDGRLNLDKLQSFIDISKMEYEHYLIGPPSMVDDTNTILRSCNVDPKRIHTDSFDGYNEEM